MPESMTEQASENSRPGKEGKVKSFYMRYEHLDKLSQLAKKRGVVPNRMMRILIEEAEA